MQKPKNDDGTDNFEYVLACPICNRPVYYHSPRYKDGEFRCYICKKQIIPIKRDYKPVGRLKKEGEERLPKGKRWNTYKRDYKTTFNEGDVPTRSKVIERIHDIEATKQRTFNALLTLKVKALCSFIYLTGCRREEAVGLYSPYSYKKIYPGVKAKQFSFNEYYRNKRYVVIKNIAVFKTRPKPNKKGEVVYTTRNVPILYEDESELLKYIIDYYNYKKEDDETEIFDMSTSAVFRYFKRFMGFHPHLARHCRCTHLVEMYGFDPLKLQSYMGWTNSDMASRYTHLNWHSLTDQMLVGKEMYNVNQRINEITKINEEMSEGFKPIKDMEKIEKAIALQSAEKYREEMTKQIDIVYDKEAVHTLGEEELADKPPIDGIFGETPEQKPVLPTTLTKFKTKFIKKPQLADATKDYVAPLLPKERELE